MMGDMRPLRLAAASGLVLAVALVPGSCAKARNYTDPAGPLYVTRHARTPPARDFVRVVTFNIEREEGPVWALLRFD